MCASVILPLGSPDATLASAGGKGANLSELARAGFPVPPAFVLSTAAYRSFVESNALGPRILAAVAGTNPENQDDLAAQALEVRSWFDQGAIPESLKQEIARARADLGGDAVAVRSSATAEDLPGLSFAGQQETFLNVVGESALFEAIKKCWSSLWTAQAIAYRARNGIAPEQVALAVVVQQMVQAQTSGVLFTANPLTGNYDETVIEASVGLGEAIVSGQVEPDYFVVQHGSWEIVEKQVGSKAVAIQPRHGGGTDKIDLPTAREFALPNASVIQLAQLAGRVVDHFGRPQDIEWALAEGRLFLLQARPITTL